MTIEERFAHAGAKIDQLIAGANKAKEALIEKEESARKHSGAALDEIKQGLDKAWQELNQAWNEICRNRDSAESRLPSEEQSCDEEQERERTQSPSPAEEL